MSDPREHHYVFAHQVLPGIFYSDPDKFFNILTNEDNFLRFLWKRVGEDLDEENRLTADGLDFEIKYLEDNTVVGLVIFPPPKGITEAYFVAMVYRPPVKKKWFSKEKALVRFFTLEHGINSDGSPRTVLCEWTNDESHLNLGNGPEAIAEAFLKEVYALLK